MNQHKHQITDLNYQNNKNSIHPFPSIISFTGNQNYIESLEDIESLESNENRPTTAQWLRTLISSVSRPTTTSTVYPPPIELEEDDDNPAIIELNETTSSSTNNNLRSANSTISRNQISSNYIPSFHQATRPSRRHLFSRARTRTRVNGIDISESDSRTNTAFTVCSVGLDETITSIETLEIENDNNFCSVIGTIQNFQTEEGINLDESDYLPCTSITSIHTSQPAICPTNQENNNCLMTRNARPKQSTSSQMRS